MKIPRHLNHKPIIAVNNYRKIDGVYSKQSDAPFISIGLAQYHKEAISVKVWRHTGKKWSRQSEELPIHRALDLSILTIAAFLTDENAKYSISSMREEIIDSNKIKKIKDYYKNNESDLRPRLIELKKVLNAFFEKENHFNY